MSVVDVEMTYMDYPVTNVQWKRVDNIVLWDYLEIKYIVLM